MAHDILGDRMFVGTESAWHNLGKVDSTMESFTKAVESVEGMNFGIHKMPLTATMPDGTTIDTGSYGLFRDPIDSDGYAYLGNCGKDYEFWQNTQLANELDSLAAATGWRFSTAGIIHNGATMFGTLDMGDYSIRGDEFSRYFSYIESRDGRTASSAIASNIKIVCKNTHDLALKNANSRLTIRHHGGYRNVAQWALELIAQANAAHAEMLAAIDNLFSVAVSDDDFTNILNIICPMPTMPNLLKSGMREKIDSAKRESIEYIWQNKCESVTRVKNQLTQNWVMAFGVQESHLGSGYHAFQAVTEYGSNQYGTLGKRGKQASVESRANYDLLGDGLTMRNAAYSAIMDLV